MNNVDTQFYNEAIKHLKEKALSMNNICHEFREELLKSNSIEDDERILEKYWDKKSNKNEKEFNNKLESGIQNIINDIDKLHSESNIVSLDLEKCKTKFKEILDNK